MVSGAVPQTFVSDKIDAKYQWFVKMRNNVYPMSNFFPADCHCGNDNALGVQPVSASGLKRLVIGDKSLFLGLQIIKCLFTHTRDAASGVIEAHRLAS